MTESVKNKHSGKKCSKKCNELNKLTSWPIKQAEANSFHSLVGNQIPSPATALEFQKEKLSNPSSNQSKANPSVSCIYACKKLCFKCW